MIGEQNAIELTPAILIDHVRGRRADGAGAATVANDLTWIGVVLRAAKSVKNLPVRPEVAKDARIACRELRLTGKSKKRTRRPTSEELAGIGARGCRCGTSWPLLCTGRSAACEGRVALKGPVCDGR